MTFANRKFLGFLGAATVVIVAEYVLVLSDSVIAGMVLGEDALKAVNLLMSAFSGVSFFTWLLAEGTSIAYSDAMARMQKVRAANLAGQGLVAALALGGLLGVAAALLQGPYLAFMSPDPTTAELFGEYWKWYPAVILLESVDMLLLYLVYTDGGTRSCLVSYCTQVVLNVALSYGFCRGAWGLPALGMGGISLGTGCAYLAGIAVLLPRLLDRTACGVRFAPKFLPRDFARTLKLGFGDASAGLFHALLFFVVTKYLIHGWGTSVLPIATVVFCIVRLTVFFNGIGIALQPLETVYYGEGNAVGVRRLVRFAACVSLAEGLFITALVLAVPDGIVSLVGIREAGLVDGARHAVRLTVLGLAGYAVAYMLNSHYQFTGRPGRSILLTLLAFFALPVALLFALGPLAGMDGVWIALAAGPAAGIGVLHLARPRRKGGGDASFMWSLSASDPAACANVAGKVGVALAGALSKHVAEQVGSVVGLALERIRANNPGRRRVHAEITVMSEGARAVLIVRDDGRLAALEGTGHPVTHLPAAGFNRNQFVFDVLDGRYEIVRGTDVTRRGIEDVVALDGQYYEETCYHMTVDYTAALFKANEENCIAVRDRETGTVVGYAMLLPVSDETYARIRAGSFVDSNLTLDMVVRYGAPGIYHLYFASVVVHPGHRSARLILTMMDAIADVFLALANRGIFIDRMIADSVSRDGSKFCSLFGLERVRASDHKSDIYELVCLPPRFRALTPTFRRLANAYRKRCAMLNEAGQRPHVVRDALSCETTGGKR